MINNGYATLAEFKAQFGVTGIDLTRDGVLEAVIEDASREIDNACSRVFYGAAPASARYFTATSGGTVFIDTATSITAVATDQDGSLTYATAWAATDYRTMPTNAAYIDYIEVKPLGSYSFDRVTSGVKVTAVWGYNLTGAHPGPIRRACLLLANRIYERRKAAFGMTSASDIAPMTVLQTDPDLAKLLAPYIKNWGG